ncbi:LytR/AlgR family response regulator transcription factor [Desulfofalx alkaliphila]|uniref:LytR/AlgR family response regulator transcription factor n=1 Tax=Desulfofalx alkaliphila TaxID=105483 RepID=UPI0004E10B9F|nr:LytTR family DNA-binding domain-containing protein [Desulfofalx alkaliphila]
MKLRALIVDDEYPARQELRYLLSGFDNVEIVGEATNANEALALIKALDYHLLFLDISMPGMNGLELGEVIQQLPKRPQVIFVSAYDEHALKAFEVNAVDYILKPVEEQRLRRAVEKVWKACQDCDQDGSARQGNAVAERKKSNTGKEIKIDRIPAEKMGKTMLVDMADIFYAFTEKDYVYIKTNNDKLLTKFTLKELEARLNPAMFFRTHRCYLVNLHKVKEIIPFFNGTYNLLLEDESCSEVPVSRAQAKKLRKILGF